MRIHFPEPDIKLHEDGFKGHDLLDRTEDGKRLSELVSRIDDPLVIALDGAWGSGKTVFLKCWVGEHQKREGNEDLVIYFDAFAHDFMDDPLISLIGAIGERQSKEQTRFAAAYKGLRKAAPLLARAVTRFGLAAATAGASELVGAVGDAALKAGSDEADKAIDAFWKAEDGRRAAMTAFRESLLEMTGPDEEGRPTRKLIVVIDELDRCRPDYALSLLEIIKHFFAVDGVHFVLGVNLAALGTSVEARYGAGTDAQKYLQKFYHLTMTLSPARFEPEIVTYLEHKAGQIGVPQTTLESLTEYCKLPALAQRLTLRDIERVLTRCALLPDYFDAYPWPLMEPVLAAIFLETIDRDLYRAFRARTVDENILYAFFGVEHARDEGGGLAYPLNASLHLYLARELDQGVAKRAQSALWERRNAYGQFPDTISATLRDCLDQFTLPQ